MDFRKDGKEVDFCLCQENQPYAIYDAKAGDDTISPTLRYFNKKVRHPGRPDRPASVPTTNRGGIDVRMAIPFLEELYL